MTERTYTPPSGVVTALVGSCVTLDELERVEMRDDALGIWARRTLIGARQSTLNACLGSYPTLPVALVASLTDEPDSLDVVVGLRHYDQVLGLAAAGDASDLVEMPLTENEIAFVLRHLDQPVVLHPAMPLAWMTSTDRVVTAAVMPPGAVPYAVLDEIDRNAVLDVIAVLKGPKIIRRLNGNWHDDPTWASILRSVRPPKVVPIMPDRLDQIIAQVDESTKGDKFEPTVPTKFVQSTLTSATAFADASAALLLPIIARGEVMAKVTELTGSMPAKLKKYWTFGAGAARIRWSTPGAMTRCAHYMTKYVGPGRAYSTCNNLSKTLGGKGKAWDVGG